MDSYAQAAVEPFMVRSVAPIKLLPREERLKRLEEAWWNAFRLRSGDVFIDLLTDSGTGAMSVYQWVALVVGDEAYAGSRSWHRFETTVKKALGVEYVLPMHQERAAERILYTTLMKRRRARVVPANTHFVKMFKGYAYDIIPNRRYSYGAVYLSLRCMGVC